MECADPITTGMARSDSTSSDIQPPPRSSSLNNRAKHDLSELVKISEWKTTEGVNVGDDGQIQVSRSSMINKRRKMDRESQILYAFFHGISIYRYDQFKPGANYSRCDRE